MYNMAHVKSEDNSVFRKKNFSKKIKIFFTLMQVLFSLDFGFIEYKSSKIKILFKLYVFILSLCQGISILVILFKSSGLYFQMWGIKVLLEYYTYILILIFTPGNGTFCFYQMELEHFDRQIGVDSSSYKLDTKILLFWLWSAMFDILLISFFYIFRVDNYATILFLEALFYIPKRTYNFPLIVLFFVFYSILCRLRKLKIYIKKRKSSVMHAHRLYRFLIDSLENVLETFKYIFLVNLMFNIPAIMVSIYTLIKTMREADEIKLSIITPYIDVIHTLTVKFVPTLAASWLSQEAINVKLILQNRLLNESIQSQAIRRFIKYTDARPFKFYILSMVPMDVTLLVIVFKYCVTYLLVIIQLTHVY